jgi:pyruvate-ferredoxin/flavodoxin oxidoreductase
MLVQQMPCHVIILMASGAETPRNRKILTKQNEKVGVLTVRLYGNLDQTFDGNSARQCRSIAVLDRTKEPGSEVNSLQRCCIRLQEGLAMGMHLSRKPRSIGGRFGLSSKEFTPVWSRVYSMN